MQDPTYPIQLATELRYPDPQKLGEVLKDCVDILVVKREGVKDYNNTRKRRIDNAVLNDLPKYAKKIKKLFQHNIFDFWLKSPSFKLHFVEFHFDIDQLDLLSILTLNSIDEAIAQEGEHSAKDTDVKPSLNGALEYWETLQARKMDWVKSGKTGEFFLEHYRSAAKLRQKLAGMSSATGNRGRAVADDLRIAFLILQILSDKSIRMKIWPSMNSLADALGPPINAYLEQFPIIGKESYVDSVSQQRIKSVIKEINYFDKSLLGSFVKVPIPEIKAENSRWRHYKIVRKFNDELKFHYLDVKAE